MTDGIKRINQLLVSTYDLEGGASRSTFRLFKAFEKIGFSSEMLVQFKTSIDPSVIAPKSFIEKNLGKIRVRLDPLPLKRYMNYSKDLWSIGWLPHNISKKIMKLNPNIVHLNWVGRGFLPIKELCKIKKPIVWTFHDMWAFTGGCHYAFDCKQYTNKCGKCPQLGSNKENDLSRKIWQKKNKFWENIDNMTIVTPSNWLAECTRSSLLFKNFKVEVIPYVINTDVFKPINKETARYILNIPLGKKIILFGGLSSTTDKRKGFQYLIPALKELEDSDLKKDIELIIFGALKPKNELEINFKTNYLGFLNDDISLSIVYSACDVFVMPSIQDNFPNTVLESLACSAPVVAFNIGGNSDMIEHKINGYLAKPFDIDDLANGIKWVLSDDEILKEMSLNARKKVENKYNINRITSLYLNLFDELVK